MRSRDRAWGARGGAGDECSSAIGSIIGAERAYQEGGGYVGFGEELAEAVPSSESRCPEAGRRIIECPLTNTDLLRNATDQQVCEWLVAVRWAKAVALDEAVTRPGILANQNVVCRLRDTRRLELIEREFGAAVLRM